jgi:hypothetical protein
MMLRKFALGLFLALMGGSHVQAIGEDYIQSAPATVYEAAEMSPQNMDFDSENNMFVAHSGWYNDREIHYYKFRMFTPSTYEGVIAPGSTFGDVPMQKIYIVTTTGDMSGAIGKPIIEYHTADGNNYSDFMEINLVTAPEGYTEDMYRSEGDITGDNATVVDTGIVCNIPVVPTNSILQHPALKGTDAAPISPVAVWYKGVDVQTFVFEVTDQLAADYFAPTRTTPTDSGFNITVINFANADVGVFAIPLWHLNQYSRGVTEGNGGGPSPTGMRNIINLDRTDAGYSPLWQIHWVTDLPLNYLADEVSNSVNLKEDDGFVSVETPMFVNCPDIGSVGTEDNPNTKDNFQTEIDTSTASTWIQGSHMTLIMQGDVQVSIQMVNGTEISSTQTNMLGGYEIQLMSSDIPNGTKVIDVLTKGELIRAITIQGSSVDPDDTSGAAFVCQGTLVTIVAFLASFL